MPSTPIPSPTAKSPLRVERDRPIRIYLVNVTEFDPINSFHLHGNFFDYYDHGTTLEPTLRTVDTVMQCQAQRGIIEIEFRRARARSLHVSRTPDRICRTRLDEPIRGGLNMRFLWLLVPLSVLLALLLLHRSG